MDLSVARLSTKGIDSVTVTGNPASLPRTGNPETGLLRLYRKCYGYLRHLPRATFAFGPDGAALVAIENNGPIRLAILIDIDFQTGLVFLFVEFQFYIFRPERHPLQLDRFPGLIIANTIAVIQRKIFGEGEVGVCGEYKGILTAAAR